MKSLSIVVPVYNGAETIQTCLEAILHLDYPEELLEIIVVNDGSTDHTLELIQHINSPRIRTINNDTNRGRAFSRLRGARESTFDFLLLIDSRVVIDRGALFALEKAGGLIQSPAVIKGTGTIWNGVLNSLRKLAFRKYYQNMETTCIDLSNFDSTPKGTGALYTSKELFIKATMTIDYENKDVSDDTKLLLSLIKEGNQIYLNPDFSVTYLHRAGFKENVVHLFQRGPKFVDYYYGMHTFYTFLINLTLLSLLFLAGLVCLGIINYTLLLLIVLSLHVCFAVFVGDNFHNRLNLFFLLPVIVLSFGCGIVKGLWIKGWKTIRTDQK